MTMFGKQFKRKFRCKVHQYDSNNVCNARKYAFFDNMEKENICDLISAKVFEAADEDSSYVTFKIERTT